MNCIKVGLSIGILCIGIGGLFILKENNSNTTTPKPTPTYTPKDTTLPTKSDVDMINII